MAAPRRNVELKASDPDPERSLAVVLGLGRRDRGRPRQRDTYFRVAHGPPEAARGGARRRHADPVRPRRRRRGAREPLPARRRSTTPAALRAALEAALGTLVVVEKERHLLLWESVRIHLDRVAGPRALRRARGRRRPRTPTSRASSSRSRGCTEALEIAPERDPARLLLRPGASAPTRWSRRPARVMERAHAPYSPLPRRRRAARRGRLDPRRRQRRERRLPAGPVRRGVGDRRAGRRRAAGGSPRSR